MAHQKSHLTLNVENITHVVQKGFNKQFDYSHIIAESSQPNDQTMIIAIGNLDTSDRFKVTVEKII